MWSSRQSSPPFEQKSLNILQGGEMEGSRKRFGGSKYRASSDGFCLSLEWPASLVNDPTKCTKPGRIPTAILFANDVLDRLNICQKCQTSHSQLKSPLVCDSQLSY